VKENKIIEWDIKPELIKKAEKKAKDMGRLNNSITRGQGNIAGFLGEFAFVDFVKTLKPHHNIIIDNSYDYDIIYQNITGDVKTKRTNYPGLLNYEASISNYNPNQKCDIYIFVRVMNDQTKAYICGWIPKQEYFEKARFMKEGDYDPSNNWYCKGDCYNLSYSELNGFFTEEEK